MKGIRTIVTVAVVGAALFVTNPGMEDFGKHYARQQVSASQKKSPEALKDLTKAVTQSTADLAVKIGFKRDDKFLFSFFTLGPASRPSKQYIGLAKFVFIKIK